MEFNISVRKKDCPCGVHFNIYDHNRWIDLISDPEHLTYIQSLEDTGNEKLIEAARQLRVEREKWGRRE